MQTRPAGPHTGQIRLTRQYPKTHHEPSTEAVTILVESELKDTPCTAFVCPPDSVMALVTWLNSPSLFLLTSSTFTCNAYIPGTFRDEIERRNTQRVDISPAYMQPQEGHANQHDQPLFTLQADGSVPMKRNSVVERTQRPR